MEKMRNLAKEITSLKHDIKAEVIINNLLKSNDIDESEYVIFKNGQFSRAYRYDILDSDVIDYDFDTKQMLKIALCRDGLYDVLPQNLIHAARNDSPEKEVDSMIREYKLQKKQQKESRLFFQPFENEIFTYGVKIEGFEQDFLSDLNGILVPDMFYDFWGISRELPSLLVSKFIRILPFAYKIVADIDLACEILSTLLEEKVTSSIRTYQKYQDEDQSILLGESRLGLELITGNSYDDYSSHFNLQIGPLKNSNFSEYIHEGTLKRFVDLFYEYFFPIEVEIETTILLSDEKETFEFTSQQNSILGYNTRI
ncbi:type VI secretion system baseplate subunit TssG [Chryseobacterium wangxinyae]|uniref:type VI secretion system baseplate subunit TssG n=1 Tax=Chryseobacterium sp. CY350 TaxID=2997336 RepID=UPI00226FE07C|nr:type VI secretion system baseplate subunit TssG [Chryseobacterium sp. CY350]MCY0977810.1 type VI secretion system baseplate subunit TssG [Chryseobacterium sp. CY350]WBZ94898.1 type VI secretion system baseplate subunit TssG [Chryseobacterium sp. CY350]